MPVKQLTLADLFEVGAHFGHRTRFWNPKMEQYIFGERQQVHIINLDQTVEKFQQALNFVDELVSNRGRILFVGTKRAAERVVKAEAERCEMPYVNRRWLGGMLTNYKTIRKSIKRLSDLQAMFAENAFEGLTKKERLNLEREMVKLQDSVGGIQAMGGLPEAVFIVDIGQEKTALLEANKLGIPVIAVVDSNCDPDLVDYVIPANDDSQRAIQLYLSTVADVAIQARERLDEDDRLAKKSREAQAYVEQEPKQVKITKVAAKPAAKKPAVKAEKVVEAEKPAVAKVSPDEKKSTVKKAAAENPPAKSTGVKSPDAKVATAPKAAATKKKPVAKKATPKAPAEKKPAAKKAPAKKATTQKNEE